MREYFKLNSQLRRLLKDSDEENARLTAELLRLKDKIKELETSLAAKNSVDSDISQS